MLEIFGPKVCPNVKKKKLFYLSKGSANFQPTGYFSKIYGLLVCGLKEASERKALNKHFYHSELELKCMCVCEKKLRVTCQKPLNAIDNNVITFIISMDFLIIKSNVKAAPIVAWVDMYSYIFIRNTVPSLKRNPGSALCVLVPVVWFWRCWLKENLHFLKV